jgi:TPR repeat protein
MKTSLLDRTRKALGAMAVGVLLLVTSGSMASAQGDNNELIKMFRESAERGEAWAQNNLGVMYDNGEGVAEDDAEAVKWYRKAAEQGDAAAQNNLGVMYDNGEGVAEDDAKAVKWYRKAAEQGDAKAQSNLGVKCRDGQGAAQNYVLAHMWLDLARAQGNESARKYMESLVTKMTKEQIAEAQRLASEWQAKHEGVGQ